MPIHREALYFGVKISPVPRTGARDRFEPAYLRLHHSGELAERARIADQHLEDCDLCARYCRVNRKQTLAGVVCRTGELAVVNSWGPHHGEEDCLRGWRGSGTVFFSWCNMRCVFCQNWEISWKGRGEEVAATELADIMLNLQAMGCHNINFVSPSHVVAQILAALDIAARRGLRLPLVYNSGGYDSPEALALLDGVIDIYMPDMKYGAANLAKKYSHTPDYVQVNQAAVREMHRQVGDLKLTADNIAQRGLLVRHLVLPNGIAGTEAVVRFLAEEISRETYVNIMDQYRPNYRASEYSELDRMITDEEYRAAVEVARSYGLKRLDRRCSESWVVRWP
ncbi:MAG: radical SAM protein [Rhodospirillales bacterium]|nr:MAG: radical SAM protein [Rhodospirillales bacterium]